MKRALLLTALFLPLLSHGSDVYRILLEKQEKKADTRWSLAQWLEQRDRMRLMDLWLALHSPSPYEFFLASEYQFGKADGSAGYNANAMRFSLAAYASVFGLEGSFQTRLSEWSALFKFRIFGYHVQGTNLTLEGGLRSRKDPGTYNSPVAGLSFTFYLFKNFGVSALYRHYFASMQNDLGIDETGNRLEGEVFIDFNFVRVYGQYFSELLDRSAGPAASTRNRTGAAFGAKLFF